MAKGEGRKPPPRSLKGQSRRIAHCHRAGHVHGQRSRFFEAATGYLTALNKALSALEAGPCLNREKLPD
jgi:hypothetical protein